MTPWQSDPAVVAAQRRAVRVLFIAQAVGGLAMGVGASLGSLVAYEVTGDESLAGAARVVSALSVALVAVPLARLAASRGRRAALALGWATALAGTGAIVWSLVSGSVLALLLGMLLYGAGTAANLQTRFAAADLAAPQDTARTIALVLWAGTFGTVLGPQLAVPGVAVAHRLGLPEIAGGFVLAAAGVVLALLIVTVGLRPDPALVARARSGAGEGGRASRRGDGLRAAWSSPVGRFALVALVLNQTIMVAVMVLTPVHMQHGGHGLPAIGTTLSLHTLGMFAFSPLVGMLARRAGERATILVGMGVHTCALLVCLVAGHDLVALDAGLFLLGLGWSFGVVGASALLTRDVPVRERAAVQGAGDTLMNVGAAVGAGLAGPVMTSVSYRGLAVVSLACVVPVVVMALRLGQADAGGRPRAGDRAAADDAAGGRQGPWPRPR